MGAASLKAPLNVEASRVEPDLAALDVCVDRFVRVEERSPTAGADAFLPLFRSQ